LAFALRFEPNAFPGGARLVEFGAALDSSFDSVIPEPESRSKGRQAGCAGFIE
jgi:hypothetical protein